MTTDFTGSNSPVFDPGGKYLYFVSNRDFNEVLGNYDFEFANPKTARVYIATLRADEPSPFPALSDEVTIKKEEAGSKEDEKKDEKKPETKGKNDKSANERDKEKKENEENKSKAEAKDVIKNFKIDLDGIQNRIVALPMPPTNVTTLTAAKDLIVYSTTPVQGLSGPLPGESPAVHGYDLKERKDKVIIENVDRFALSFDGAKLLYQSDGPNAAGTHTYGIIDVKGDAPKKVGDGALNLGGLRMEVDPVAEWQQIFHEVWRQERDYFFEAAMNGIDWNKEKEKYEVLLPYAANRYDVTYLMGEMIGDLSNSHTYVGGGDYPEIHPVNVGLLGTDYEVDNGFYRFKRILPGENWDGALRSPLTEPGVKVKEGDYLIAVNGRALRTPQTPFELLTNTAGDTVTLTINSKPSEEGAHTVQVKPIPDEFQLRERDWVESNRKKVEAATQGKVGYIYIPDMGGPGLNEFVKQWFPQIRKQGMIIDVRYNGGGFVDQLIFARLRRILVGMGAARNFESTTVPPVVFHGYMACVTNQYAASDGDIFSQMFKVYKLGPLIGERTWGGVRGIRGQMPLLDGGYITRPEFSRYDLNSKWVIENRGVAPDIEVDNRPDLVVKGQDQQLDRAIQEVMKQIQANPLVLPNRPPDLPTYPEGPGI